MRYQYLNQKFPAVLHSKRLTMSILSQLLSIIIDKGGDDSCNTLFIL